MSISEKLLQLARKQRLIAQRKFDELIDNNLTPNRERKLEIYQYRIIFYDTLEQFIYGFQNTIDKMGE